MVVVVVAYRILLSAPVPFGLIWVSNWVGLDWDCVWGDWGLRGWGWGLGLDNLSGRAQLIRLLQYYQFFRRVATHYQAQTLAFVPSPHGEIWMGHQDSQGQTERNLHNLLILFSPNHCENIEQKYEFYFAGVFWFPCPDVGIRSPSEGVGRGVSHASISGWEIGKF